MCVRIIICKPKILTVQGTAYTARQPPTEKPKMYMERHPLPPARILHIKIKGYLALAAVLLNTQLTYMYPL